MNIKLLDRTQNSVVSASTSTLVIDTVNIETKSIVISTKILSGSTLTTNKNIIYVDDNISKFFEIRTQL